MVVLATASALIAAACNNSFIPDYNAPTQFSHSVGALQSEFTGMFDGPRVDAATYALSMEGFARNAAYFTASEQRFVTQYTGMAPLDNSNFGAGVWANEFSAIKVADSVISVLPTLTVGGASVPAANLEALFGVAETIKALDYLYIAEAHDTNGVAVNGVGLPLGTTPAPILCNKDVWVQIVNMLDSAVDSLAKAGAGTAIGVPGTTVASLLVPSGYSQLGATSGGWSAFALALRGKARVEYAYAIARNSPATAPTLTSPGSPDQNQLDSAIIDITGAVPLYSPSLTSSEAVAANDLGVFHYFTTASGDRTNSLGTEANAIFALQDAVAQIDTTDKRFLAKFAEAGGTPSSSGGSAASHWSYQNNISPSTPIPIVRNLELQFVLAQAYLGLGQYTNAINTINAVRVNVGGLADTSASVSPTYTGVRDFLLHEQRPTLIMDGTGDRDIALREYGLVTEADTTWIATKDYQTSMQNIPLNEANARGGNITPVCP
jgi:hypothetical protein